MVIHTSFNTLVLSLFAFLTVMHAAEPEDNCPDNVENIANMCSDDFKEESSFYGRIPVDSILLRITKQQNNCICHVSLPKTVVNYTIYMTKYNGFSDSAPKQQHCGLAVDVEIVDSSDTARSLQSIECTSGTSMRSIDLGGSELILKSRIIDGDFDRGYCMQIYRNQALYTCKMLDQANYAGSDDDWIKTNGTQHISFDECKSYCLKTEACVSVHFEGNYCFVYNRTTAAFVKGGSSYSVKQCIDTKKLKIRCFRSESIITTSPETTTESTTTTSQSYSQESITKTSIETTTEENHSKKMETVTTPTSNIPVTSSDIQSTIEVGNNTAKDKKNSDLFVYIGAAAGGVLMILLIVCIIMCIRKRSNQTSLKETQHDSTQKCSNENGDSNYDYGELKDNILYVSSEPNEVLEDGNYNTVDLEQTRKVDQDNTFDGNYSTVDGICNIIGSDSSLSKSKPVIKPKPKTSFKNGSDEETIHLSTMDNSNNEYAVVDKGRNSDAVKHINPEHGKNTEYAVVNKIRK